jgi:hypothetical protein
MIDNLREKVRCEDSDFGNGISPEADLGYQMIDYWFWTGIDREYTVI